LRDPDFVLKRKGNIFCLGAVAQGGIVDPDGTELTQNNVTSLWISEALAYIRDGFGMLE
jgi:hypothetical protein